VIDAALEIDRYAYVVASGDPYTNESYDEFCFSEPARQYLAAAVGEYRKCRRNMVRRLRRRSPAREAT
jgi:hypothetical protein